MRKTKLAFVEPWSVAKNAFVLSIAMGIVLSVALAILWWALYFAGAWETVSKSVSAILSSDPDSFDLTDYIGFNRLMIFAGLISALNVVLFTAIATIGTYLFNVIAKLTGGIEIFFDDEQN